MPSPEEITLQKGDELQLQQLRQIEFWREHKADFANELVENKQVPGVIPQTWELTRGVTLHDWQEKSVSAW
jgi:hypothetical protein